MGSKVQNNLLTENGPVAYQIKESDMYNNMQAVILSLQAPWVGSKGQNSFSESSHVADQIIGE